MRVQNYRLKSNKSLTKDDLISMLFDRLSETNMSIDRAATDLGEENLGFHEGWFYLDLIENLAPNEELIKLIEDGDFKHLIQ